MRPFGLDLFRDLLRNFDVLRKLVVKFNFKLLQALAPYILEKCEAAVYQYVMLDANSHILGCTHVLGTAMLQTVTRADGTRVSTSTAVTVRRLLLNLKELPQFELDTQLHPHLPTEFAV